jgi:hypothetical protein
LPKSAAGLQEESPGAKTSLLVGQDEAITGPVGPDAENASGPEEECPDAEVVWEGLGKGDLETNLFEAHTDRFIVSYDILQLPKKGMPSLYATVENESGRSISSGHIPSPRPGDPVRSDLTPDMGRAVVDTPPGTYKVAISPSDPDRRYAVLVEECGESPAVT